MSLTMNRAPGETILRIDPSEANVGVWFAVLENGTRVHFVHGHVFVLTDDGIQQVFDRPVLHRCVLGQTLLWGGGPLGDVPVVRLRQMDVC